MKAILLRVTLLVLLVSATHEVQAQGYGDAYWGGYQFQQYALQNDPYAQLTYPTLSAISAAVISGFPIPALLFRWRRYCPRFSSSNSSPAASDFQPTIEESKVNRPEVCWS